MAISVTTTKQDWSAALRAATAALSATHRGIDLERLVREARDLADRGDYPLYDQAIRGLDDLVGRWVGREFLGGSALVRAYRASIEATS